MIQKFEFQPLTLQDAWLITPFAALDERGAFIKDYSQEIFQQHGIAHELKEVFYTVSHKGVMRAIHFQREKEQAKLVRCISGEIYDVIVDLRKNSPTLKKWMGFTLSGENRQELLVPAGFGHGYLVVRESVVSYKCAEKFYGEYDDGILWSDPDLNIDWPLERVEHKLILSEKDKSLQSFQTYKKLYLDT